MQGSRGGRTRRCCRVDRLLHPNHAQEVVARGLHWQQDVGACLTTGGRQPRNTGRGGIVAARHSHFLRVGHKLWIRGARLLFARCGCRWCRRRRWWCRRRRWPSCIPARGCPELAQASVGKVLRRATKSVRAISTTSWLRARGGPVARASIALPLVRGATAVRHAQASDGSCPWSLP